MGSGHFVLKITRKEMMCTLVQIAEYYPQRIGRRNERIT